MGIKKFLIFISPFF